jgi:hypothetical protein
MSGGHWGRAVRRGQNTPQRPAFETTNGTVVPVTSRQSP